MAVFSACLPACDEVGAPRDALLKPCYDEGIGGISGCAPLVSAPDSAPHKPNRRGGGPTLVHARVQAGRGTWACRGVNETDRHFGARPLPQRRGLSVDPS